MAVAVGAGADEPPDPAGAAGAAVGVGAAMATVAVGASAAVAPPVPVVPSDPVEGVSDGLPQAMMTTASSPASAVKRMAPLLAPRIGVSINFSPYCSWVGIGEETNTLCGWVTSCFPVSAQNIGCIDYVVN